MNAGLAPGQIRRGLRIFRTDPHLRVIPQADGAQHVFHRAAVLSQRDHFRAIRLRLLARAAADAVDSRRVPAGRRASRAADRRHPFRMPDAWRTISGRSWAIHDGILGRPFTDVQMYKRIGERACVETFPGAVWSLAASGSNQSAIPIGRSSPTPYSHSPLPLLKSPCS